MHDWQVEGHEDGVGAQHTAAGNQGRERESWEQNLSFKIMPPLNFESYRRILLFWGLISEAFPLRTG